MTSITADADVRDAHERFLAAGSAPTAVRSLVADSWARSLAAGVAVDEPSAPLLRERAELRDYRAAHPLSPVFPLLYDVLGRAAEECDAVMAVGDERGQLLWVCGSTVALRRAEHIRFVEGAAWDEASAGTNAPGTALRLDAPVLIRAAEHFARPVQPWSCAAAPIHDPVTRAVLGLVDVTGGDDVGSPQTLAMVRAAARMAEAELGRLAVVGGAVNASPASAATVVGLGRPDCEVHVRGRALRLTPRHSEILVLLADQPGGVSGDRLAVELYADDVRSSTMRAELARLRHLLGPDLLDSRPYRLHPSVRCDWVDVAVALDEGRVADAVRLYRGPLLPPSESPGVVERRTWLERRVRAAVLGSDDVDLMAAWTRSRWGADDAAIWHRQAQLLPASSPLRRLAVAEADRLDRELA